jgi:hypothetical protein
MITAYTVDLDKSTQPCIENTLSSAVHNSNLQKNKICLHETINPLDAADRFSNPQAPQIPSHPIPSQSKPYMSCTKAKKKTGRQTVVYSLNADNLQTPSLEISPGFSVATNVT